MKKWICALLALCLCAAFALAEDAGEATFKLSFEEGFSLSLPEGWVSYPVGEADAVRGLRYALGDGRGERYLYVQSQKSDVADFEALREGIDARGDCSKTDVLNLNGQPFASFVVPSLNASGCATLLNGEQLTFLFTPQSDSAYMLTIAKIMAGFRLEG